MSNLTPDRGCIVVVERGAVWPARVFQGMADRAQVAIVAQDADETEGAFSARIARRAAALATAGVSVSTVVLVCAQGEAQRPEARAQIARDLAGWLAPGAESRLVLTSDGFPAGSSQALFVLAGMVLDPPLPTRASVQVWASAEPLAARLASPLVFSVPPPRRRSGVRLAARRRARPAGGLAPAVA